jgi:hypothetical protein
MEYEGAGIEENELTAVEKQRWVGRLCHLFGQHNSSCRVAGAWRMWDHKKLRGPFCTVTKMPLILPKNRNR